MPTEFYDKQDDFNLEMVEKNISGEMFLAPFPIVYIFRRLFALRENVSL